MSVNSMLNIKEGLSEDDSIVSNEIYQYYPETGTQYNSPGNITISVNNSDTFFHPANSWLEFEGQIVEKVAGTAYTKDKVISLVNYGILYIFDLIKYTLNGTPIETVFNPGLVANILGLATFPDNFKQGVIESWAPDTSADIAVTNLGFKTRQALVLGSEPSPLGSFRISVPLKRIFGFADDYEKILYGFNHGLILTRSTDDDNALCRKAADVNDGKITLNYIRWMLPRVVPNDLVKLELLRAIKEEITLSCGFRMRQHIAVNVPASNTFHWRLGVRSSPEQPRFIFLCFQTAKSEDQTKLNTVYDNCKLTSAHILLNNDRYPLNDFETNFGKNHFDNLYNAFHQFRKKFYGVDPIISSTCVDPISYRDIFPILCFDVSKQSERLKSGVTDITLQCRFSENVAAKTIAHVVIISDRKLKFKSDGEKLSVIF